LKKRPIGYSIKISTWNRNVPVGTIAGRLKASGFLFIGRIYGTDPAAVINHALADLEKDRTAIETSPAVKDAAMTWINGPDCEGYCLALDMDYAAVRGRAAALYRRFLEKHDKAPGFSG
jgi:hypothetical protein